jgi:hypothetical protein
VKELRDNVINELLTTEQSYMRDLHVLNYVFKDEMTHMAKIGRIEMTLEEVNTLFGYSQIIMNVNMTIVEALIERLNNWNHDTSTVSDILFKLVRLFVCALVNYLGAIS